MLRLEAARILRLSAHLFVLRLKLVSRLLIYTFDEAINHGFKEQGAMPLHMLFRHTNSRSGV